MDREDLSAGEAALRFVETHARGVAAFGYELDGYARVAVTHAAFEPSRRGDGRGVPLEGVHAHFGLKKAGGVGRVEGDEQGVVGGAFAGDDVGFVVGVGGDADAFALAEGVVVEAGVRADGLPVGGAHDGARVVRDVLAEKILHLHLTDEADALAVFFRGVGQAGLGGEAAEFGLGDMADGKAGVCELGLRQEGEEVGLVFVFVGTLDEGERTVVQRGAACVVAGGDGTEAVVAGPLEENPELDLAVAHDVGVGREAPPVSVEQIRDDAFAILLHQIDDAELDAEAVADSAGVLDVLHPRTMADDVVLVDPVLHVGAHEVVALLLEQQGGDGAVHSARHGDEDFFAGGHQAANSSRGEGGVNGAGVLSVLCAGWHAE